MSALGAVLIALLILTPSPVHAQDSSIVYRLAPNTDAEWGRWTPSAGMRIDGSRVLGPFGEQAVTLRLGNLPEHEIIRARLRIELVGQWIDQVAPAALIIRDGVDRRLLDATFAHPLMAGDEIRQSYPNLMRRDTRPPGAGAVEAALKERPERLSAVYDLDLSFRHGREVLNLVFEAEGLGTGDYWVIHRLILEAKKPEPVEEADLQAMWEVLGTEFDASAHGLFSRMVGSGRQLEEFLAGQLRGGLDIELARRLINQLDDERFMAREEATNRLIAMGVGVIAVVEEAARGRPSVEKAERIRFILESIGEQQIPDAERVRYRRAVNLYLMTQSPGDLDWLKKLIAETNLPHVRSEAERMLAIKLTTRDVAFFREVDWMLVRHEYASARDRLQERLAEEDLPEPSQRQSEAYLTQLDEIIAGRARIEAGVTVARPQDSEAPSVDLQAQWAAFDFGLTEQALKLEGLDASGKTREMIAFLNEMAEGRRMEPQRLTDLAAWLTERDREPFNDLAGQVRMLRLSHLFQTQWQLDARARLEAAEKAREASSPDADLLEGVRIANRMSGARRVLGGGWVEVLSILREGAGTFRGRWSINAGGSLSVDPGEFSTYVLPIAVPDDYELRLRFSRVQGNDGIFVRVPVGQGRAGNLNLGGWNNAASGLEWIDQTQVIENRTAVRPSGIRNDVVHQLHLQVTRDEGGQVNVQVNLDGKGFINWSGRDQQLSEAIAWGQMPRDSALVIGSHQSRVVFSSIQVRPLNGELKRLEQPQIGQ